MAADTTALKQIVYELRRSLNYMNAELDRIEILTAALFTFNRPVPDYEPYFHHLGRRPLRAYELNREPPET